MMESFLPSEVGRLIYGYLAENNQELADSFLNSSNVMEECRLSKRKSRKFSAKVQDLSLVDILDRYSVLCSLIFKQGPSSQCVHQNIMKLFKNIVYTQVREHNEQLANEILAQDFTFNDSRRSDTTYRKRNENDDLANESILRNSSTSVTQTMSEITPHLPDNSVPAGQDVESMDVSSSSTVNESHNSTKTLEKTVQTEPISVNSVIENEISSLDNNDTGKAADNFKESNKTNTPDKPKHDSTINLTLHNSQHVVPQASKENKKTAACKRKDADKPRKSSQHVICKIKQNMMQSKNPVFKSKMKAGLRQPTMSPKVKAQKTKPPDDLLTPPEAEKGSLLPATVLANLSLNPNFRKEHYVTPYKRFRESSPPIDDSEPNLSEVTSDTTQSVQHALNNAVLEVDNRINQASKSATDESDPLKTKPVQTVQPDQDEPSLISKKKSNTNESPLAKFNFISPVNESESNSSKDTSDTTQHSHALVDDIPAEIEIESNPSKVTTDITQPVEPAVGNAFHEIFNSKNHTFKSIPNILKKTSKPDPLKINTARNVQSNQVKPPPTPKPNSDSSEPASKPTSKSTENPSLQANADSLKHSQSILPRTPIGPLERRFSGENPRIQRPPPIIDAMAMSWDSKLRNFVGDLPEGPKVKNTRKTPRKTPHKTPRKLKRESTNDLDEQPKKRSKKNSTTPASKKQSKKTKRESMNTSSDLDKSAEDIHKANQSRNVDIFEPQPNQPSSTQPQTEIRPSSKRESLKARATPEPESTDYINDSAESSDKEAASLILRTAVENMTRSQTAEIDSQNVAKSQTTEVDSQLDEIDDMSDYGMNLTLEEEVLLYEANLTPL
ncbi:dentin sialophosphoprotein-like isoform X1 [Planococcus citri]|uniref:dentin sialophosphoprotein-like isoform X1 n=1 Tax=Planococcus citri TaxID=170843 RepID=UPI0031F80A7F